MLAPFSLKKKLEEEGILNKITPLFIIMGWIDDLGGMVYFSN